MSKQILDKSAAKSIASLLQSVEDQTRGKIIVHIDEFCKGDAFFKAAKLFREMNLLRHLPQNSSLIYIASTDKKIGLVFDKALDAVLLPNFATDQAEHLAQSLHNNMAQEGIEELINKLLEVYLTHFPVSSS